AERNGADAPFQPRLAGSPSLAAEAIKADRRLRRTVARQQVSVFGGHEHLAVAVSNGEEVSRSVCIECRQPLVPAKPMVGVNDQIAHLEIEGAGEQCVRRRGAALARLTTASCYATSIRLRLQPPIHGR